MDALDFTQLYGVEDQTDVAIPREPGPMVLVGCLIPTANPVGDHGGMTANIKHRWQRLFDSLGQIEIGCDIEARQRLKMKLLHAKRVLLECACDNGLQVSLRRHRVEA